MKKAVLALFLLPLFDPAMAAAKPPALTGTVTDPTGRPVAGARVWALAGEEIGQRGWGAPSAVTASDARSC